MPTQPEIDDVLAKVTTYQAAKQDSDEKQAIYLAASNVATSAQSLWDNKVASGEDDTATLTDLLTGLIAAQLDSAAKYEIANAAQQISGTASNAINNTIYAILHPDP